MLTRIVGLLFYFLQYSFTIIQYIYIYLFISTEETNQALALTVKMTYKLLINCQEAAANAIRVAVASMITGDVAANWPDLCKSCTPTVISKCQSGKFLDVEFTITNLG